MNPQKSNALDLIYLAQQNSKNSSIAKTQLIEDYTPLCKSIVNRYLFDFSYKSDLLQAAYEGLLKAVEKHNLQNFDLCCLARSYIKKEVLKTLKIIHRSNQFVSYEDESFKLNDFKQYTDFNDIENHFIRDLTAKQSQLYFLLMYDNLKPKEVCNILNISRQRFYEILSIIKKKAKKHFAHLITN